MRAGFPHSEICGSAPICRLPAAYRRLSRPSSPVIAKASTSCTYSLDPITLPPVARSLRYRASLSALVRRLRPFQYASTTMQYITQVLADAGPNTTETLPSAKTPSISRIFKDQPILGLPKKPEESEGPAFALFYLLFDHRPTALVEPTGIEPVTSCLQSRRSPS